MLYGRLCYNFWFVYCMAGDVICYCQDLFCYGKMYEYDIFCTMEVKLIAVIYCYY
jgi:hypothetical protein